MRKKLKKYFLNFLCILSSEDYRIIEKCNHQTRYKFALIGFWVLMIFSLCFFSSLYAIIQIFNAGLIGIPLGFFFAWMITNIYLLLLYTLSKNVLPHTPSQQGRAASIFVRLFFISFIAMFIAKPFEAMLFNSYLKQDIASFKEEKFRTTFKIIENNYEQKIADYQEYADRGDGSYLELLENAEIEKLNSIE
jgi:hypothetical protein